MEPGTGKAVPVRRGQILRLEQVANGQVADSNFFNLHDYKEYFHAGRTRHLHGLWPGVGAHLWSNPPRERPMMTIIEDSFGRNSVLYPRCSGFVYEYHFGYESHTNCADILAEAVREYELTPDDVHDSFNFWGTGGIDCVDGGVRMFIEGTRARADDYIHVLAQIDTLAVPCVCGADVMATSNFELKPLKIQVFDASEEEKERWLLPEARQYKNQRTRADFKRKEIKATPGLVRDETYVPEWPVYPIVKRSVEIEVTDEDYEVIAELRRAGHLGDSDGDVVRYGLFTWYVEHKMRGPKHFRIKRVVRSDAARAEMSG